MRTDLLWVEPLPLARLAPIVDRLLLLRRSVLLLRVRLLVHLVLSLTLRLSSKAPSKALLASPKLSLLSVCCRVRVLGLLAVLALMLCIDVVIIRHPSRSRKDEEGRGWVDVGRSAGRRGAADRDEAASERR